MLLSKFNFTQTIKGLRIFAFNFCILITIVNFPTCFMISLRKYFITLLIFSTLKFAYAKKPNILFIFVDDLSPKAIGFNDPKGIVKTPNIDAIAKSGVNFRSAYIMGSWVPAVSVASRTCLVTGLNLSKAQKASQQAGVGISEMIKRNELWPQKMKEGGYATFMTGKWHLPKSADPRALFDKVESLRSGGMPKAKKQWYGRPIEGKTDPFNPSDETQGGHWAGGKHWSEVTADCAINYIKNYDKETPFFMYVAFNAPHDPRQSPQKYLDMYDRDLVNIPVNFIPDNNLAKEAKIANIRDENLAPKPRTEFAIKTHLREYYAIITHLDDQVGRIISALKDKNLQEDTIIIFASDNGLQIGEHGLMGKQNLYESSIRVPLIISGRGFEAKDVFEPVYMQSLATTAMDIAGVKPHKDTAYTSLLPVLKGKPAPKIPIYSAYAGGQESIIKDGMKLISVNFTGRKLLFDLNKDPNEINDISRDPKNSELLDALYEELKSLRDKN